MCPLFVFDVLLLTTPECDVPSVWYKQLAWAVQVFAAEMRGPKDRPQERPKGAFGQEYPQARSSAAGSAAVAGPFKVCPLQAALRQSHSFTAFCMGLCTLAVTAVFPSASSGAVCQLAIPSFEGQVACVLMAAGYI